MNQTNSIQTSSKQLIGTLVWSVLLATIALIVFVLPAEYGLDSTGLGKKLGVTGMAGYSVSALSSETNTPGQDYVEFPLAPFESIEYKYSLSAGQAMVFSWTAEGELVFDFHSEEHGTEPEDAVSFSAGRSAAEHGTYVAPYDGIHGWFWENRGAQEVTVKLRTHGFYDASTTYSRSGAFTRKIEPGNLPNE